MFSGLAKEIRACLSPRSRAGSGTSQNPSQQNPSSPPVSPIGSRGIGLWQIQPSPPVPKASWGSWGSWGSGYTGYAGVLPSSMPPEPEQKPKLEVKERTEPAIGFRAFKVEVDVIGDIYLKSVARDDVWNLDGVTTAKCDVGYDFGAQLRSAMRAAGIPTTPEPENKPHSVPDENCHCGLYIVSKLEDVPEHCSTDMSDVADYVVAAVVGWGKVVQHGDEGFRAEHARLLAFLRHPMVEDYVYDRLAEKGYPVLSRSGLEIYAKEFGASLEK